MAVNPAFRFYLHYTRPIRTAVMVGLPMAYLTAVTFAIYLVSAFLLRVASGYPFSVLPAAAWIAAIALVLTTIGFSTRSMVVLMLGWLVTLFVGGHFVGARLDSFPNDVDYPLTDYAVIALIGLVCFGVTVASVARQRRGDAQTAITRTPGGGLWAWLIDLFPFPCPTSSATRAQVWLDLKFNGLPVLTIGVVLAMVILLVSAVSGPIDAAMQCGPCCVLPDRGMLLCPSIASARPCAVLTVHRCWSSAEMSSVFAGDKDARTSAHSRRLRRAALRSWPPLKYS